MTASRRVAAIDCGSNSIRLLVVDAAREVVARGLTVTRLGQGVDETGVLADDAIARTVDAIARFVEQAVALGAAPIRIVATSAVRDARDRDRFLDAVERASGVRPDVLDGDAEAGFSFRGATSDQPGGMRIAIVDIGGGSTELVVGRDGTPERYVSTQIGCVRHTERLDAHGVLDDAAIARIDAALEPELAAAVAGWPHPERLIGVAGTVTSLAAIDLGLATYAHERVHGHVLPLATVEALRAQLAAIPSAERLERYRVLSPGREDVIVVGASILLAAMRAFAVDEVRAGELEILHGVVAELLAAG